MSEKPISEQQASDEVISGTYPGDRFTRATASLVAVSAIILVGTEVIGIAAATAWALGGLLHFGALLTWLTGAVFCAGAAWLTYVFGRNVWSVEKEALSAPPEDGGDAQGQG
jgi:hypothetical protein